MNNEFVINYSRQFDIGEAIRIMKQPNDKLFVAPDEWLVYWQAEIEPRSKMINYYAWMARTPPLKEVVDRSFASDPPTFVYLNMAGTGLEEKLKDYVEMERMGTKRHLFVNTKRYNSLSEEQKNNLRFFDYQLN